MKNEVQSLSLDRHLNCNESPDLPPVYFVNNTEINVSSDSLQGELKAFTDSTVSHIISALGANNDVEYKEKLYTDAPIGF